MHREDICLFNLSLLFHSKPSQSKMQNKGIRVVSILSVMAMFAQATDDCRVAVTGRDFVTQCKICIFISGD